MEQNVLNQSDCRIFKLTISPERKDEKAWLFACWHRVMEIKSWLKNIWVGMVKNGCDHPGLRTLKLAIPQKGSNEINWFLVCWQKFRKAKIYFDNFLMVVIENGRGFVGLGTLKSAVSQLTNELGWFFACWYKFMKAKNYFNNYWAGVVKNGQGLKDRGTLKPGISHKWFDELSRLNEWFLHADSDGILLFCCKWCPILAIWKLYAWEKSASQVIGQNAHHKSDCRIF